MSNQDEASRAKEDAEAARKIAMKAQKMDPRLKNIDRMLMVCDVHCAVLKKSKKEFDWYGILQVELTADDTTIKKQYKRLAFLLHPDKNKLPGSESAFKAVGEAYNVLSDQSKRKLHDRKREPFRKPAPVPSYQHPATTHHTNTARNKFSTDLKPEKQQKPQAQPTDFSGGLTIWTLCIYCYTKQQFEREFINKVVTCVNCGMNIVAMQEAPPVKTTFHFPQHNKFPTQEAGKSATQETSKAAQKQPDNSTRISPKKKDSRAKSEAINGKRKRKEVVESSESEDVTTSGQHNRRSVRSKQRVSYKENISDDDNKQGDAKNAEGSHFRKKSKVKEDNKQGDAQSAEESHFGKKSHENPKTLPNRFSEEAKVKEDNKQGDAKSAEESHFGKKSHENPKTLPNRFSEEAKVKEDNKQGDAKSAEESHFGKKSHENPKTLPNRFNEEAKVKENNKQGDAQSIV